MPYKDPEKKRLYDRAWWQRWRPPQPRRAPRVLRPWDDMVLVLAVLCGLLGVVWTLYVLGP